MEKPASCNGCPIATFSQGFIQSEGDGITGVAIIGEAGGHNEYIDGLPFRPKAQAGSKLEEVFKLAGFELRERLTREHFTLGNVVNCHPPSDRLSGEKYELGAIEHCRPNVDKLYQLRPQIRVTLALGNTALKALTGLSGIHEEKQSIQDLRGYVLKGRYGWLVPGLHPAFLRRGKNEWTPLLVNDLKKALAVARGQITSFDGHPSYSLPRYQTGPGLDEAWQFYGRCKDNPRLPITYDIETPKSAETEEDEREELEDADITLMQFSLGMREGIAFPYEGEYIKIIDRILKLPNVKAGFNCWNFDNPRIRAKGHTIEGRNHDLMWMFKHWQPSLPRGLQSAVSLFDFPFAWKHLYGLQLRWYGCADVDSAQWLLQKLPPLMQAMGVWDGYKRHVADIHPIMERARVTGIPVDETKRTELTKTLTERRKELHKKIQAIVPLTIRNVRPRRKNKETGEIDYGYLTKDAMKVRLPRRNGSDTSGGATNCKTVGDALVRYNNLSQTITSSGRRVVPFEEFLWKQYNLTVGEFEEVDKDSGARSKITRLCVVDDFKASSKQLIAYLKYKQEQIQADIELVRLERATGYGVKVKELEKLKLAYKVPLTLKTKRETTGKKDLEEIYEKTSDTVLEMVVRLRSIDTNLNNYIPNWQPGRDERVHTTWGYGAPSGQFDSRSPNILNCSKHTEIGNEFRGIIQAPAGYTFVEFDKKSYHVATMGYCANDRDYIRFSQIDPHSILGSYIDPSIIGCSIDLRWSDADCKQAAKEFKARCKAIKAKDPAHNVDVRQELAKPTVLGNQLGLGPVKLQHQNRKFIHYVYKRVRIAFGDPGLSAEELQAIIAGLFAKVEAYKTEIKNQAFVQRYLKDEFGRIQFFYDVYTFFYSKKRLQVEKRDGEGARDPVAFRVQGTAFGALQLSMLEFERIGFNQEMNFINSIHDSLIFMPEKGKLEKCLETGSKVLAMPCHLLVNEATGPLGLVVGTDVSVGRNWKTYDKTSNPEGMQEVTL